MKRGTRLWLMVVVIILAVVGIAVYVWLPWRPQALVVAEGPVTQVKERNVPEEGPVLEVWLKVSPELDQPWLPEVAQAVTDVVRKVMEHAPQQYKELRLHVRSAGINEVPSLGLDFDTTVLRRLDLAHLPNSLLNFATPDVPAELYDTVREECEQKTLGERYRSLCIRAVNADVKPMPPGDPAASGAAGQDNGTSG